MKKIFIMMVLTFSVLLQAAESVPAEQEGEEVVEQLFGDFKNDNWFSDCVYQQEGTNDFNDELKDIFEQAHQDLKRSFLVVFIKNSGGKMVLSRQDGSENGTNRFRPYLEQRGLTHCTFTEEVKCYACGHTRTEESMDPVIKKAYTGSKTLANTLEEWSRQIRNRLRSCFLEKEDQKQAQED